MSRRQLWSTSVGEPRTSESGSLLSETDDSSEVHLWVSLVQVSQDLYCLKQTTALKYICGWASYKWVRMSTVWNRRQLWSTSVGEPHTSESGCQLSETDDSSEVHLWVSLIQPSQDVNCLKQTTALKYICGWASYNRVRMSTVWNRRQLWSTSVGEPHTSESGCLLSETDDSPEVHLWVSLIQVSQDVYCLKQTTALKYICGWASYKWVRMSTVWNRRQLWSTSVGEPHTSESECLLSETDDSSEVHLWVSLIQVSQDVNCLKQTTALKYICGWASYKWVRMSTVWNRRQLWSTSVGEPHTSESECLLSETDDSSEVHLWVSLIQVSQDVYCLKQTTALKYICGWASYKWVRMSTVWNRRQLWSTSVGEPHTSESGCQLSETDDSSEVHLWVSLIQVSQDVNCLKQTTALKYICGWASYKWVRMSTVWNRRQLWSTSVGEPHTSESGCLLSETEQHLIQSKEKNIIILIQKNINTIPVYSRMEGDKIGDFSGTVYHSHNNQCAPSINFHVRLVGIN